MKLFFVLALTTASLASAGNPQLKQVSTVYILAMSGGMDQYLANQLTTLGVFQVVTDPKKADAIITDRLGEPFEEKLKDLYPPPPPPAPLTPPPAAKDDKDTKDDKDAKPAKSDAAAKDEKAKEEKKINSEAAPPRVSSFNRGRGNFFIVDRNSRNVVWSIYDRPKDTTPGELSKTAGRVVKRLRDDLADKKQPVE